MEQMDFLDNLFCFDIETVTLVPPIRRSPFELAAKYILLQIQSIPRIAALCYRSADTRAIDAASPAVVPSPRSLSGDDHSPFIIIAWSVRTA